MLFDVGRAISFLHARLSDRRCTSDRSLLGPLCSIGLTLMLKPSDLSIQRQLRPGPRLLFRGSSVPAHAFFK